MWSVFRDMLHYCAVHLESIADNARDLDLAIRWGFGWNQGPFEIWQATGWPDMAKWIAEDIAAGKSMSPVPLPAWVTEPGRSGVHTAQGSWSVAQRTYKPRPTLPVYRRQPFPDRLDQRACRLRQHGIRNGRGAHVDHRRRHRNGQLQDQDAFDRRGRTRRRDAGNRRGRARLQGPDHLADRAAVLGRRQSLRRRQSQEPKRNRLRSLR